MSHKFCKLFEKDNDQILVHRSPTGDEDMCDLEIVVSNNNATLRFSLEGITYNRADKILDNFNESHADTLFEDPSEITAVMASICQTF